MITTIRSIERRSRRAMLNAGVVGIVVVAIHNLRLAQRESELLIGAKREFSTPPVIRTSTFPRVSVLVAAWNEADHIDQHITSFLGLTYPEIELIICAGGTDDTWCRARQHACERVIVIEQRHRDGKQRSLARCLEHATGDIIYLTDADCRYSDDALFRVLAPIIDNDEHVATGVSRPLDEQQELIIPIHVWAADFASSLRQADYVEGMLGRNAAVSRIAIDQIGGLDFAARTGTDYQLARRLIAAGFRIRFVRCSVVASEYPPSIRAYRQKQSRWLRNLILHGPRYQAHDDVRLTRKTIATGLTMTLAPLVALPVGGAAIIPWLVLVFHAAGARVRYLRLARSLSGRPMPLRYLPAVLPLTVLDFVIWTLPIFDLIDHRRRETW